MWLLEALSLPYLKRHRLRTILCIVGIATGVASVVATGAVCDSVFASFELMTDATRRGADFRIGAAGAGLPEELSAEARDVPGVEYAAAIVQGFVTLPDTNEELMVIGLDLLFDPVWRDFERSVDTLLPDESAFISEPDSVLITRGLGAERKLEIGSKIDVLAPSGPQTMKVRGLISSQGPAVIFGSRLFIMDLTGAQMLLGKGTRVDFVDVWAKAGTNIDDLTARLEAKTRGMGNLEQGETAGQHAKQVLGAIRVFLSLAAFVAAVVGFFIVYHTVDASIHQRRRNIAVVHALGVSRRALIAWLIAEITILGAVACVVGYAAGMAIAKVALSTFENVTTAWIQHPAPTLRVSLATVGLSFAVAIVTSWGATLLGLARVFSRPTARVLTGLQSSPAEGWRAYVLPAASVALFVVAAVAIAFAPTTLEYVYLLAYVLVVNGMILLGFGLLGPWVATFMGRGVSRVAQARSGVSWLVAGANLARSRTSFVVAITAIVMGIASTLATLSLTTSLKTSSLAWLDEHYRSDLIISAKGAFLRLLTAPPLRAELADEVRRIDGVAEVQALRVIEIDFAGLPAGLQAFERSSHGLAVFESEWDDIAAQFWNGDGVLLSDNLARLRSVKAGDEVVLDSPSGRLELPVLATYPDYLGGSYLGSVAIGSSLYTRAWRDDLITRLRVWLAPGADIEAVRAAVLRQFGPSHGIEVLTFSDAREEIVALIDDAFALMYALVAVAALISFIGILNSLLIAVGDRGREFRLMLATGVPGRSNLRSIVCEGLLVGSVGVFLGLVAGLIASWVITIVSVPMVTGWRFHYHFPVGGAVIVAVTALVFAAAAGVPPGWLTMLWKSAPEGAE